MRNARRVESLLDDLLLATDITTALPVGDPEAVDLVAAAQAAWDALDVGADLALEGDEVVVMRPARRTRCSSGCSTTPVATGAAVRLQRRGDAGGCRSPCRARGPTEPTTCTSTFELFYRGEGA